MKHLLPELPYQLEALAPKMSKETLEYHYGKHLQTYIDNLNKLIAGTPYEEKTLEQILLEAEGPMFNNAAQTWNHTFFFDTLTPQQPEMPSFCSEGLSCACQIRCVRISSGRKSCLTKFPLYACAYL